MTQKRYLIEKIVRGGRVEYMSAFIEHVHLEPADIAFIDDKIKVLGYALNTEEISQLQACKNAKQVANCKEERCCSKCSPHLKRMQNYTRYIIPLEQKIYVGV